MIRQLIKRRVRELIRAHLEYMIINYGVANAVDEQKEFDRIYADYQLGRTTLEDIDNSIAHYRKVV